MDRFIRRGKAASSLSTFCCFIMNSRKDFRRRIVRAEDYQHDGEPHRIGTRPFGAYVRFRQQRTYCRMRLCERSAKRGHSAVSS